MFTEIKKSLHEFGVDFDVYFHENDLHESGAVERAIARLRELGMMYEQDDATWLRTSDFGDDKDRVVIKSDGQPAYISGDLAYYLNKRERGFDRCIIMLGADHHGYVSRMLAMCAAFGDTPKVNLELLIGQLVNLVRDGEPLRMSKRAGTVITLEDLVDSIGVDAARYALARYSTDSTIDLDLDLWAKQDSDNPVYYVQYAHARLSSIIRNAVDLGVVIDESTFDPSLLAVEQEGALLRALADYPRIVARAAELREPHRVARYLEDTAAAFHKFYDVAHVLPKGDEEPSDLHRARLDARRGDAAGHRQRPRPARRQRPGAYVMRSHEAGALHGQSGDRGPAWLRTPEDPNELVPHLWSSSVSKVDGVLTVAGESVTDLAAEFGTPTYVVDEDDFRRRARGVQGGVPQRRRLLRRQGVPLRRDRSLDRRGGAQPRRVHRRRARRGAQGRVPARAHRPARQQQVRRRAAPRARGRRRPHHHRLDRGDRAAA